MLRIPASPYLDPQTETALDSLVHLVNSISTDWRLIMIVAFVFTFIRIPRNEVEDIACCVYDVLCEIEEGFVYTICGG